MNNTSVFARAGRTLLVRSCKTGDGDLLFVLGDDQESRSYAFAEASGLKQFRRRLENYLLETGWSLFHFGDPVIESGEPPATFVHGGALST
jgi:hypothetical protein